MDPWHEIDELERDPVAQDAALDAAMRQQELAEREGTAAERILASPGPDPSRRWTA